MCPPPTDPIAEAKSHWIERGWQEQEADLWAALTSIIRAQRMLVAATDRALRPLDLNTSRYEALYLLYFSDGEAMSLGEMSQRLQVHPTSITSMVDRLESQGLVSRSRVGSDRRVVLAQISPAGRAVIEKAREIFVSEILSPVPWSRKDVDMMFRLLARLRQSLGDELEI